MRTGCLLIALILLISCNVPLRIREVARIATASGRVEAIVIEANTGPDSSSSYDIYLVPSGEDHNKGSHVASLYSAKRNDKSYGVNLKWNDQTELSIEYLKAEAAEVLQQQTTIEGQEIRVILSKGIEDAQAPAGIMQNNLRNKNGNLH